MQGKGRVSPFFCRKCNPAFIPLVLILVFLALVLRQPDSTKTIVKVVESESTGSQWHDFIPKPDWSWLGQSDPETENCTFDNYVLGQPIDQEDPCLIATFKKEMLIPIPPFEEQNHEEPNITGEMPSNIQKFNWVEKLLIENSTKKDGFFIECGANDGSFISPTIRLEKKYGWKGLLIEANPIPFEALVQKKRNAYAVNAAACITPHPKPITFFTNPNETGVSGINRNPNKGVTVNVTVQCIPMYTMLKAINVSLIDYLSLDVEGLELEILKTLPWDKVQFKMMTVEYYWIPGKQQVLKDFLEPRGYKFVKEITDSLTVDCLFVHESLYEKAKQLNI